MTNFLVKWEGLVSTMLVLLIGGGVWVIQSIHSIDLSIERLTIKVESLEDKPKAMIDQALLTQIKQTSMILERLDKRLIVLEREE